MSAHKIYTKEEIRVFWKHDINAITGWRVRNTKDDNKRNWNHPDNKRMLEHSKNNDNSAEFYHNLPTISH